MFRLKGCPRCKGDTLLEKDRYGWRELCLQCGYTHDILHRPQDKQPAPRHDEELVHIP